MAKQFLKREVVRRRQVKRRILPPKSPCRLNKTNKDPSSQTPLSNLAIPFLQFPPFCPVLSSTSSYASPPKRAEQRAETKKTSPCRVVGSLEAQHPPSLNLK